MATAEAQQAPRNWDVCWIAGGTSVRSIRLNPQDSASGTMVVVSRYARSTPVPRALSASSS
jgi:hypothetical protein